MTSGEKVVVYNFKTTRSVIYKKPESFGNLPCLIVEFTNSYIAVPRCENEVLAISREFKNTLAPASIIMKIPGKTLNGNSLQPIFGNQIREQGVTQAATAYYPLPFAVLVVYNGLAFR
ncbi:MAG: hypothetical protein ACO3DK_08770 [Bacteroidia bacterium]